MPLNFLANLILILSVLGILILFLRRVPEAIEDKNKLGSSTVFHTRIGILDALKKIFSSSLRNIWHFMLEAKDLKEGRAIAANFSKIVSKSGRRVINIAAFNSLKKAEKQISEEKVTDAEQTYYDIIKKHPHEYPAYEGLVKLYSKQKKFDEVIEIMDFLILHNPNNDLYYSQLGKALFSNRRYQEAIEAYEKSFELNNLISARYANAGLCYQALGNLEKAENDFRKALDLEPANVQYLMMLVDTLMRENKIDEAKNLLEKGAEMDPENALIRERLMQF